MQDLTLNIVQDSGKRKLLRDLTATLEAGFAKIMARDAVLGKKIVFGIEMIEVRDVGLLWKRNSPPPPPHPNKPRSNDRGYFQGEVRTHLLYGR